MEINTKKQKQEIVINIEDENGVKESFSLVFDPSSYHAQKAVSEALKVRKNTYEVFNANLKKAKDDMDRGVAYVWLVTRLGDIALGMFEAIFHDDPSYEALNPKLRHVPVNTLMEISDTISDASIRAIAAELREGKIYG